MKERLESTALVSFGYQQSKADYSLFTKKNAEGFTIVLVYVDDLMITGNDAEQIANLKRQLSSQFHMKDLGALHYFLGLEVTNGDSGTRVLEVEGRARENLYIQFSVSTDLSSVSHIDLQEPVSGIGTSKHQVTSSGHIGYSGHSSSANPIATNITENVSGTVVGDHGMAVQCISSTRQFNTLHISGDRNTSASVNIICGVLTPASSDGTSITVATDIAHDLPN
ncbi:retrovirus-related pol polyprotein from transposon TNT 1-94 [Tanacetum coccineum]|uniref:Retrovirus-related pol polyprotein from transposon TNT 1-94 n=1 Tax=Tanacetum coccineum TaxID=301880 RepID=A0ABQ5I6B2_9ASTR